MTPCPGKAGLREAPLSSQALPKRGVDSVDRLVLPGISTWSPSDAY